MRSGGVGCGMVGWVRLKESTTQACSPLTAWGLGQGASGDGGVGTGLSLCTASTG
jgi:hypothetical protein